MARITDLRTGSDGHIREAELMTSTRRTIHRPVNLLIRLEIQEHTDHQPTEIAEETSPATTSPDTAQHQYNLFPRPTKGPVQPTISAIQACPTRHEEVVSFPSYATFFFDARRIQTFHRHAYHLYEQWRPCFHHG